MFRSWAASVKLAEVTRARRSSMITHLACRLALLAPHDGGKSAPRATAACSPRPTTGSAPCAPTPARAPRHRRCPRHRPRPRSPRCRSGPPAAPRAPRRAPGPRQVPPRRRLQHLPLERMARRRPDQIERPRSGKLGSYLGSSSRQDRGVSPGTSGHGQGPLRLRSSRVVRPDSQRNDRPVTSPGPRGGTCPAQANRAGSLGSLSQASAISKQGLFIFHAPGPAQDFHVRIESLAAREKK